MEAERANDEDLRHRLWEGSVPVVFELAATDIVVERPPHPYYLLLPRNSYLPLYISPVRDYFLPFGPPATSDGTPWFSHNDLPLKWHYPIGVLFDVTMKDPSRPWNVCVDWTPPLTHPCPPHTSHHPTHQITVHFSSPPPHHLLPYQDASDVQWLFLNAVKEATYLKSGSTKSITDLSKSDQTELWESFRDNSYQRFWNVMREVTKSEASMRFVPLRIVRMGKPVLQHPVTPQDEEGQPRTLGAVLLSAMPDCFSADLSTAVISVHGIQTPPEMPITWLSQYCSHPDGFLYVIL